MRNLKSKLCILIIKVYVIIFLLIFVCFRFSRTKWTSTSKHSNYQARGSGGNGSRESIKGSSGCCWRLWVSSWFAWWQNYQILYWNRCNSPKVKEPKIDASTVIKHTTFPLEPNHRELIFLFRTTDPKLIELTFHLPMCLLLSPSDMSRQLTIDWQILFSSTTIDPSSLHQNHWHVSLCLIIRFLPLTVLWSKQLTTGMWMI